MSECAGSHVIAFDDGVTIFVLVVLSLASGSLGLDTLDTAPQPGLVGRRYVVSVVMSV